MPEIFMILALPIFRYFFHGPVNAVLLLVIPTAHPFFTPLLMLHPGRASASPTTPKIIHGCRLILKKMLKTTNILLQNLWNPGAERLAGVSPSHSYLTVNTPPGRNCWWFQSWATKRKAVNLNMEPGWPHSYFNSILRCSTPDPKTNFQSMLY